jgi:hypothetical protein
MDKRIATITVEKKAGHRGLLFRARVDGQGFSHEAYYDTLKHAIEASCTAIMVAEDQEEECDCKPESLIDLFEDLSKKASERAEPIQVKVKKINL